MARDNSSDLNHLPSQVELEFLAALLEPDDQTYPWNPADEESEGYFIQREQQFPMQDVLEEELEMRSNAFYNQLDLLWSDYKHYNCNTNSFAVTTLQETLSKSFASHIPTDWLKVIARKAVEIFDSKQSAVEIFNPKELMREQLIQCVQSLLPTCQVEDLLVLSRPLTYAMRGQELPNLQYVLETFGDRNWTSLSEIEQAKVSLAVAHYAFGQLELSEQEV